MAIKFEDDKGGGAKAEKRPVKPTTAAQPEGPEAEAETQLPFAKAKRPEKKRKGR